MGRRPSVSGGRPVRVTVPLSKAEKALLDGLVAQLGYDQATILRQGIAFYAAAYQRSEVPPKTGDLNTHK